MSYRTVPAISMHNNVARRSSTKKFELHKKIIELKHNSDNNPQSRIHVSFVDLSDINGD